MLYPESKQVGKTRQVERMVLVVLMQVDWSSQRRKEFAGWRVSSCLSIGLWPQEEFYCLSLQLRSIIVLRADLNDEVTDVKFSLD